MPCCRSVRFRRRTAGRASPFRRYAVRAFAALFAPHSARVSRPFDFVSVGAHETDVVGCRVVRLTSGRTDSQYEFRHVTAKRTSIQQLIISRTKMKLYLMFFCYLKKMNFNYYYLPGVDVKLVANSSLQ